MSLTFQGIVDGLVAYGVPRPVAEAQARRECGLPELVVSKFEPNRVTTRPLARAPRPSHA